MNIAISDIKNWCRAEFIGDSSLLVKSLLLDSRTSVIAQGSMFVCIKGERHNGHRFIPEMYKKGVRLFLISETVVISDFPEAAFLVVDDTLKAFHQIASAYRAQFHIPVVAITGSNAKTIVKEWLAHCLLPQVALIRNPKSYNSQVGVPLSVLLIDNNHEMGIFEAGISKPGEMDLLRKVIQPSFGLFTNIGTAHQEGFQSLEHKVKEKLQLFKEVSALYYCRDHEVVHEQIMQEVDLQYIEKISWSLQDKDALFNYQILKTETVKSLIQLKINADVYVFELPFSETVSIENALHVVTFLLHRGFRMDEIEERINSLPIIAMRMEQIRGKGNSVILNDAYNSDFNALQMAMESLMTIKSETKTLIISDIDQTGLSRNELYQQVADLVQKSKVERFIGIGSELKQAAHLFSASHTEFYSTTEAFLQGLQETDFYNSAILVKGARRFALEKVVAKLEQKMHETVLEINIEHLVANLNYFRSLHSRETRLMVMAKALTYGSGGKEIASILQHQKVDYLGVAFADEGEELRKAGIQVPIMVLSPVESNFQQLINYELEPEIYMPAILTKFAAAVSSMQLSSCPVHLKIDTGMHRLGFTEDKTDALIDLLKKNPQLHVKSIMTHLAVSDNPNEDEFTRKQIKLFVNIAAKIEQALGYSTMRHVLNSAGIERFPEAHFDMVRLGIGLHGISSNQAKLKATSRLRTIISQTKFIPAGDTIGYNRRGKSGDGCKIAIIPIGYADGLNRRFGNGVGSVMINGKECPFVGDICMDMSMIDISDAKDVQEGDEVVIFGAEKSIVKLADEIGTIPYEILTSISQRVKRIYVYE